MAYDLHGFWDADVKTLGSIMRPQTDIREIDNDTLPLWFDKLTPAKVNLGLAYYGRGYTVSDPKCGKSTPFLFLPYKANHRSSVPGVRFQRPQQSRSVHRIRRGHVKQGYLMHSGMGNLIC